VVDLPTYPFQRQRYWLQPALAAGTGAGQDATGHPLLPAALTPADTGTTTHTGRLSLGTHPWLADHAVAGTVLLPGTVFAELALHAAHHAGCDSLDELTLHAPLAVPGHAAVDLQVTVSAPGPDSHRTLTIHSRPAGSQDTGQAGRPWTSHATATLPPPGTAPVTEGTGLTAWPPAGATPLDVTELYDRLADRGYNYGPAFQGLHAAWQHDGATYAEITLPADFHTDAARYGIHPALLDAALHATVLTSGDASSNSGNSNGGGGSGEARLAFSWAGVSLHAAGAVSVRACVSPAGPGAFGGGGVA
jgi:acyl transferase domain-containing protein